MSKDIFFTNCKLSPRVVELRKAYFNAVPEICVERPLLITQFHRAHDWFKKDRISILEKARAYRHVLEKRDPVVWHERACTREGKSFPIPARSLFAGSTTSKFKGVPLYPEFMALSLWPELHSLPHRPSNPYRITPEEVKILNEQVFPHWLDHTILEVARARFGRPGPPDSQGKGFELLQNLVFFLATKPNCISHTVPCFSHAIHRGLRSLIDEARRRGSSEFYQAIAEAMEGIIAFSRNLADRAEKMAQVEKDPEKRKELLDLVEIHRRVPEGPAGTFREGLTTVWLCWIAVHLENPNVGLSLGRLDQVLYPLYRQDRESGRLSHEEALELVCSLWLKIGDHVPTVPETGEQLFGGTGSNQAITIGGVDAEGKDAVNELTYLMLRATELMKLRDPNLNARYHCRVNSDDYLHRICEVNVTTGATPAIHNDVAVIQALQSKGDGAHALDYAVVGCVEPGSNGRHYGHSGALMINLVSVLELALFNGRHRHTRETEIAPQTGKAEDFKSFEELCRAFEIQTRRMADVVTGFNDCLGRTHQAIYPTPILSALFEGPMESGKDVIEGGAKINSSGVSIVGFAEVVDSLSAIEEVVFEKKEVTMAGLVEAMGRNYEDAAGGVGPSEVLRARLSNRDKTHKFGHSDLANRNAAWIARLLDEEFGKHENYRGGRYRVGYWSMTNHAGFGRIFGATPSGRKAGANFPSGVTPSSGMTPYLTETLLSVASLDPAWMSNGVALNIKIMPQHDREALVRRLAQYVKGYFAGDGGAGAPGAPDRPAGGMEIQFNVMDRNMLRDANDHPEKYPELLVRVSGYTAYFKDLNEQMKREIIERTEYELSSGHAIDYPPLEWQ